MVVFKQKKKRLPKKKPSASQGAEGGKALFLFAVRGNLGSQRGKEGGYRLSRPASAIFVNEIMELTEGSLAPVQCLAGGEGPSCDHSDSCLTLPMWQKLDSLIDQYLSGISVQDLLDRRLV